MTGWTCPDCGAGQVCSVFEWAAVYNYYAAISEHGRRLANGLAEYGVAVKPNEDAADACKRWAGQSRDGDLLGPRYICASCKTPWSRREVPA